MKTDKSTITFKLWCQRGSFPKQYFSVDWTLSQEEWLKITEQEMKNSGALAFGIMYEKLNRENVPSNDRAQADTKAQ